MGDADGHVQTVGSNGEKDGEGENGTKTLDTGQAFTTPHFLRSHAGDQVITNRSTAEHHRPQLALSPLCRPVFHENIGPTRSRSLPPYILPTLLETQHHCERRLFHRQHPILISEQLRRTTLLLLLLLLPLPPLAVDMPPPNTPIPTVHQNGHARKRTAPVIPAIPLALSKPPPAKIRPKPESGVRAGAENVTPVDQVLETPQAVQESQCDHSSDQDGKAQANGFQTPPTTLHDPARGETSGSGPISATNGGALETMVDRASPPSSASTPGDTTVTNSPALGRKPTDRFDMRQIRTELPPAFVPSAEKHTPRSNTSSRSARPPTMPPHAHPSHPSASSIVFGGQDSSSSSPVPPQSAGSAYNPPASTAFGGASAPPFQPSGHAHHISEPHGARMYHPGMQQPAGTWNVRQGFGSHAHPGPSHHPQDHIPFRYPPRESFTPIEPAHVNGKLSRSPSQASSVAAEMPHPLQTLQSPLGPDPAQESRGAFNAPPNGRHFHQHMPPPPPPQMQPPDVATQLDNAESLRRHIFSQFSAPDFIDCQVTFTEDLEGAQQTFSGHRLVLSRSVTLAQVLQSGQASSSPGIPQAEVRLSGRYVTLPALNDALGYLYGGPLLQLEHHRPGSSAGERASINTGRMEHALQYVATGIWLKLPVVAERGVEVAGGLMHWDTVSTALAFALDGGLSQYWTIDDGSEDPFSAASSDDSLSRSDVTGAPSYEPYSTSLLQRILDFTVHVFPSNFYLDSAAPQVAACPRLPPLPPAPGHEARSSASDPRLSQIRFGEIPVGPSFTTTIISSILLSLPFPLLKAVLEHFGFARRLGPDTAASIMRQIVAERERRRLKALQARTAGKISGGTDPQLLQNLYWEELVEPSMQHKVGFRLARRGKGIDTPLSSGPE